MKKVAGFQSFDFIAFALLRSATETGSLGCLKALGMTDCQTDATRGIAELLAGARKARETGEYEFRHAIWRKDVVATLMVMICDVSINLTALSKIQDATFFCSLSLIVRLPTAESQS